MPWALRKDEKDALWEEIERTFERLQKQNRWALDRAEEDILLDEVYTSMKHKMEDERQPKVTAHERGSIENKIHRRMQNMGGPHRNGAQNGNGGQNGHDGNGSHSNKRPAEGYYDNRGGGRQRGENGNVVAVPPTVAMLADHDQRERPSAHKSLHSTLPPEVHQAIHVALQDFFTEAEAGALGAELKAEFKANLAALASGVDAATELISREHGGLAATHLMLKLHEKLKDCGIVLPSTGDDFVQPPPANTTHRPEGRTLKVTTNFSSIGIKEEYHVCHCASGSQPTSCSLLPAAPSHHPSCLFLTELAVLHRIACLLQGTSSSSRPSSGTITRSVTC